MRPRHATHKLPAAAQNSLVRMSSSSAPPPRRRAHLFPRTSRSAQLAFSETSRRSLRERLKTADAEKSVLFFLPDDSDPSQDAEAHLIALIDSLKRQRESDAHFVGEALPLVVSRINNVKSAGSSVDEDWELEQTRLRRISGQEATV